MTISDEEAARLIKEHFPKLQAAELKYRALARRPPGQAVDARHPGQARRRAGFFVPDVTA